MRILDVRANFSRTSLGRKPGAFIENTMKAIWKASGSKNIHFLALFLLAIAFVSREILLPSGHWSEEAWIAINGELARDMPKAPAIHHTWYTSIFIYAVFSEILSPGNLGMIINARIVTAALFSLAPIFLYIFTTREKLLPRKWAFFSSLLMYFLPLVSNYATFGVWPELIVAFFACMFLFAFSITKNALLLGIVAGVGICSKLIFLYFLIPFVIFYGVRQGKVSFKGFMLVSAVSAIAVGMQTAFGNISFEGLSGIVDFGSMRAYFLERLYTIVSGGYFLHAFDGYPYKGSFLPVYYILFGAVLLGGLSSKGEIRGLFLSWLASILFLFAPVAWVVPGHMIPTAPLFSVVLFSIFRKNQLFLAALSGIAILLAVSAFLKEDKRYVGLSEFSYGSHPVESYLSENLKNSGRSFVLFDPDYAFCFERKWSREIFSKTIGMNAPEYGLLVPEEDDFSYSDEIFILPKGHYSGEINAKEIAQISELLERRARLIYEEGDGTKFNVFIGERFTLPGKI